MPTIVRDNKQGQLRNIMAHGDNGYPVPKCGTAAMLTSQLIRYHSIILATILFTSITGGRLEVDTLAK